MADTESTLVIPVKADISGFSKAINDLERQSQSFGNVFARTISGAVIKGKSLEGTLRTLAVRMSEVALKAGLRPLENLIFGTIGAVVSSVSGAALGSGSSIVPFAKGGIVASPSYFNMGQKAGVMGEAGAEAILPLARGADGRMGVRTSASTPTQNITFNVSTPDVQGFRKSQGQISSMLARSVGRGRRNL